MIRMLIALMLTITASGRLLGADHVPLMQAAGPEARLSADWFTEIFAWNKSTLVEAYTTVGNRNPAWDADATALLEEWALRFASENRRSNLDNRSLVTLASTSMDTAHCTDPLVMYCVGKSFQAVGNKQKADSYFQTAATAMRGGPWPAIRQAFAAQRVAEAIAANKSATDEEIIAAVQVVGETLEQAWTGKEFAGHERVIPTLLSSNYDHPVLGRAWLDMLEKVANQHLNEWPAHYLLGWVAIKRAWKARGGGWASTVTEDGWKIFGEQLVLAEQHLTKAWQLDPTQPNAAAEMISVAMSSRTKDNERTWFDRAVAAEFDHAAAYDHLMWAMRPRWGGSHQAMLAFGIECAHTQRFDTSIPNELLDAIIDVRTDARQMKDADAETRMFADQALWKETRNLLDGIIAAPEKAQSIPWYRSQRVALAWRFGDRQAALDEAKELGEALSAKALKLYGVAPEDLTPPAPKVEDF